MTIINPNSISGISSITALNSTAAINLFKADGTSANIIAGVTTGANFITGTSNVHSTGYECTNINASGIVTAASLDISGDIDFDGHTNLDNVSIAGVTTAAGSIVQTSGHTQLRSFSNPTSGAGMELGYDSANRGVIQVYDRDNSVNRNLYIGGGNVGINQLNPAARLDVNGGFKVSGTLDANGDLDVDGHTNLDHVSIAGVTTCGRIDTDAISVSPHHDIRFTTGNWTGEHAGKIQFHDNKLWFQSGSNGWNLRNSSGTTIIDITPAGAISGQPLTLAQNLTLNNVTTIGVGRDLRFSQGNWTGEVAGKLQFHANIFYLQGGTGGFQFRNPSGVNVLSIDVDGDISTGNAPIKFDSDCLFNGGSDAVEISANGDIKLNNGNWSGEKTFKIQAHAQTMYLQAPAFIFRDDGGSNRWAINSSGHFNPATNNTYDIGNSSFNVKDIYAAGNLKFTSGAGIDFSAQSNAGGMTSELLDIYEEGTWTPYIYPMSSNIPVTYSHQSGKYTRVGNVVHFQFKLQVSNITGNRNQGFGINGFPFNITNNQAQSNGEFYGETWDGEMPTAIKWIGNTNRGVCYFYNSSQQYQASSMLDINVSSSMLMGAGHYFTH